MPHPDRFYPVVDSVDWIVRLAALDAGTVQLRAKDIPHEEAVTLVRAALKATKDTRTDIVVYGVTLTNTARVPPPNLDYRSGIRLSREQAIYSSTDFLGELAERSGGDRMSSSLPGLRRTFAKIVNDFRSRYVLTYMPNGVAATGWHRLEVRLVGRKGNVTARRGYERGAL